MVLSTDFYVYEFSFLARLTLAQRPLRFALSIVRARWRRGFVPYGHVDNLELLSRNGLERLAMRHAEAAAPRVVHACATCRSDALIVDGLPYPGQGSSKKGRGDLQSPIEFGALLLAGRAGLLAAILLGARDIASSKTS